MIMMKTEKECVDTKTSSDRNARDDLCVCMFVGMFVGMCVCVCVCGDQTTMRYNLKIDKNELIQIKPGANVNK